MCKSCQIMHTSEDVKVLVYCLWMQRNAPYLVFVWGRSLKGYHGSSNSGNGPDLVVKSLANINLVEDHVDLCNH